jgi:ferritin-like protein
MDRNDLLKKLQELAQVDIDTVHTYNRVLDEISDEIVHSRLTEFRDNHINHLTAIMEEIQSIGGEPPKLTKDFKGYVIEAFAVLSTAAGMKSALKVLKAAETISYEYYGQIISENVPDKLKERLRKYFSDEKIHLEYIDNNLKVL